MIRSTVLTLGNAPIVTRFGDDTPPGFHPARCRSTIAERMDAMGSSNFIGLVWGKGTAHCGASAGSQVRVRHADRAAQVVGADVRQLAAGAHRNRAAHLAQIVLVLAQEVHRPAAVQPLLALAPQS